MRITRYAFWGLFLWGCEASPDSRSFPPDSVESTSTVDRGTESDPESDEDRRGCGEEEEQDSEESPSGDEKGIHDDTGEDDTGEVYYV